MAQVFEDAIDVLDIESASSDILSRERLTNEFARITQFITWPILFFLFRSFFEIRIEGRETFDKVRSPFIIVANHTSFYDSFLFRLILGWNTPHLPLRFMAVNKFNSKTMNFLASIGFIDFVYSLFGVFTVTPGLGIERNIEKAKKIIAIGGNIVIYPEGSITKTGKVGSFKNGAALLFKRTGVSVVPVSFRRCKCKKFRKIIFINVGKLMEIDRSLAVEEITSIFHKVISRQHAKGVR
jgi:1-acyl-sn-glycerol-3-phosphate acyltransferase